MSSPEDCELYMSSGCCLHQHDNETYVSWAGQIETQTVYYNCVEDDWEKCEIAIMHHFKAEL